MRARKSSDNLLLCLLIIIVRVGAKPLTSRSLVASRHFTHAWNALLLDTPWSGNVKMFYFFELWPQKETVRFIRKHAKSSRENGSVRVRERQLATPWTWTFLDIVVSKLSLSIYNSFSRIVYTVSITAIIPRKGSVKQDLITCFAVVLQ